MERETEQRILETYCKQNITREQLIQKYGKEAERVISVVRTRFCKKCGNIFRVPCVKTSKLCWDCRKRPEDFSHYSTTKKIIVKSKWHHMM